MQKGKFINDSIFGKLKLECFNCLYKNESISINNKEIQIEIEVQADKNNKISIEQYANYLWFKDNWDKFEKVLLLKILEYYKKRRAYLLEEYDYNIDEEFEDRFPDINNIEEIAELIDDPVITFVHSDNFEYLEYEIGIMFECDWEPGDCLGITIKNKEITNIGWRDIV